MLAASHVDLATFMQALDTVVRETGDEHAALRIGQGIELAHLGALGFAAMTAPDAWTAWTLQEELQGLLMTGVVLRHVRQGPTLWASVRGVHLSATGYPWWSFLLGLRLGWVRQVCGANVVPERVTLPCAAPRSPQALQAVLGPGAQLAFGRTYEERWREPALQATNPRASAEIHRLMTAMARREWRERFDPDEAVILALERAILQALDHGAQPVLARLVASLSQSAALQGAVGVRQIQRKLAARQCSFRALVERVRRDRAIGLLRTTGRPLADIAAEAGYAELSSFHRAVRRWTGLTPMGIRREGVGQEG